MTIQDELITTIADLVQPGKGILAADESTPTIAKRFKAVGVESIYGLLPACKASDVVDEGQVAAIYPAC